MSGADTFGAPAEAYDRYIGRYSRQLAEAFTEFTRVKPADSAIDIGCGPGALTGLLAERLGAEKVAAVDPSNSFVNACRERLPGVEVVEAVAEALPFEDGRFDAALAQLAVNFMKVPIEGVHEMARVTRPGGTVAACVWDYGGQMTLIRAFWDAAREVEPERGAVADEAVVMPWCGEGELAQLWNDAGLNEIRFDALVVSAAYTDFDDLWSPLLSGVGPAGAFCTSLPGPRRRALYDAFRGRLGVGEEPFELTARAWAVAGSTPA